MARHRFALAGRKRLHYFHHVGIVAPLAIGKAVHSLEQIFVALTGQPRCRRPTDKLLLMAGLAYGDPAGRRYGSSGSVWRWPALAREISRCGATVFLLEAFGHGGHDRVVPGSGSVIVQ